MSRLARLIVLTILVSSVILPFQHASAAQSGLTLQVTAPQAKTTEGKKVSVGVHSGAFASLTLTVRYSSSLVSTYHGAANGHGRYVFTWRAPTGTRVAGTARLQVLARRGNRVARWSGRLTVLALPLPKLYVKVLNPRVLAGTKVDLFVSTTPRTLFTYKLVTATHARIATGSAIADSRGRYVITVPETLLPKKEIGAVATISVTTAAGTRVRSSSFELMPRPGLSLFVSTTAKNVQAGSSVGVFVSTKPGADLSVTMTITSTTVYTATGVADKRGRWIRTTPMDVILKHQQVAKVQVKATSGIAQATAATSFLLRPGPPGLTRYGFDRLATPQDPTPDLSSYFTTIPEKLIAVSTEGQVIREYEHGLLVHENYVTTGRPELPTVHGIFHVYLKQTPFTFISPWPLGSPFYYPPSPVRYWMPFYLGFGLHDAPWRTVYGPGTNLPHASDPGEPVGSHGCVNIPLSDMVWLWNWAPVGTTVLVY